MKIKTSELTRAALNWAVATAEGWQQAHVNGNPATGFLFKRAEPVTKLSALNFSTDWSQGGPITEREKMDCNAPVQNVPYWTYFYCTPQVGSCARQMHRQTGPTPLIAAMRCFVSSRLGDEVDIPEELT